MGAVDVERAAEVGLAEAVLRWPRGDSQGFEAYARVVIAAQLRRLSIGGRPHGRPTRAETSPVIAYASSSEANRNATRQRVVDGATGSVLTDLVG